MNGPTDEDLMEEISKETSKQTAVENSEEIPLHAPPSKPQSEPPVLPQEPPPEDDDIPTKAAPAVENKNEDSDHYYDRVPDQLDVSDDKDNDEDNFYEIPSSSKIPDVLPDDCLYVVSYGDIMYILYTSFYPHSKSESYIGQPHASIYSSVCLKLCQFIQQIFS